MRINRKREEENKAYILENITYDDITGLIRSKQNNSILGTLDNGYLRTHLYNKFQIYNHRIAWFLYYGEFPDKIIDHINQDKSDNRIKNLRLVTENSNAMNSSRFKSGCKFDKMANKWSTKISIDNTTYRLGDYTSQREASKVYKEALKEYEETGQIPKRNQFIKLDIEVKNHEINWKHCRKTVKTKLGLPRGVKRKKRKDGSFKYESYIEVNKKRKFLGSSNTVEEAHVKYLNALKDLTSSDISL